MKSTKKNVLVFPCGSEIGLEIYRSLSLSTHFNLLGASSVDDHGKYVYSNYIDKVSNVDDEDFIESINKIVKEYSIDYIFPAHDSVVLKLTSVDKQEIGCEIVTSNYETCNIARSKALTYDFFDKLLNVPKQFQLTNINEEDFPLFLKPDVGQGSKGTHLVRNKYELNFYKELDPSLLICEYLPGREYTVDCFTNSKGELLYSRPRIRSRVSNGISVSSEFVDQEPFKKIAHIINTNLNLRGVWFFQVKEGYDGRLTLMEFAPRVAGTMGITRCSGVNLPLLSLFDFEGIEVKILNNKIKIVIDRALENKYLVELEYNNVYIDLDDVLITEDGVNIQVISFLYQCLNKNKEIYLLTRHKNSPLETLSKHKLHNFFKDIYWLKDNELKSSYIKHSNSIFIDDSFAERYEVSQRLHLPTFDVHAIESLMENK